ncbi:hypothetical protein F444_08057 [Phytophthora nicotianae P1976]|uniref:Uncharacterized protein n=1 Tax=Phytophthora nicotianae P1976 TaxID=1317066 RepID=A0A081ACG7_PHYNI|nr:hypothetical protein F444_08057 [Phytophthora nicotianae P1976]
MGVQELAEEVQHTANEVVKNATQTVYDASFKKFSNFCIANGYPGPRNERHHELPVVLRWYRSGVNTWCVREDESGEKHGYGNSARDPFVRQFMRGLKKTKASEFVSAKAIPVSLDMLTVPHAFLDFPAGLK